jgi:hypothetical protein
MKDHIDIGVPEGDPSRPDPAQVSIYLSELELPRLPLTPWELTFLESVYDQFNRTGNITTRQYEVLARLHEEKV